MEFKRHGSNLDVRGMVIHQLLKTAGDRKVGFKKAPTVLNLNDKEKVFIGKLNESYHKKSNPTYGIFAGAEPTFRNGLEKYLADENFYDFSVSAAQQYKKVLENTVNATGSFLIFTDFINTDTRNRYMLVLTINNKDGYMVREADLTLEDIKNLDLSKVDVACMINLTRWKLVESGSDTESRTYLSFVKGNKNVSYYFQSFIDCDNKTTSTESTNRLITAIDAFAKEKGMDRTQTIKVKNQVSDYCTDCLKENKEIELSSISALMNPENTDEFREFASAETYGVSETIKGDKARLRRIKYIMYSDDNYRLEFDSELLDKDVFFNKQKNELTFKRLPQALIDKLSS
ncbi:nucleoid-associated protein [Mucilaginibacter psychrotolerans]|uniref:Nucleoid-associated protein n=1 Tax=Mucilaginibacter psychrotolerans TaxID=1524096 RepID=A0A4Y8SC22_9SPHI|nr:nucleoid-associated protein [Mucilaginibacter psychrotolerans]TFF36191.1 hypothetical protein E2R66_16755 [Mucilaginibacter psychrotolerans]